MSDTTKQNNPLVPPRDYQVAATHVFPSMHSLEWFMRANMVELVECGAVVVPAGRKLIDPAKMTAAVISIGRRRAAKLCALRGI